MFLSLKIPAVVRYWPSSLFYSAVSSNPSILFNSSHLRTVTRQPRCRHAHLKITFQTAYHLFYLSGASGHGRSAPGPGEHRLVKGNYRAPQGRSQVEVRQVTAAERSDHHAPVWDCQPYGGGSKGCMEGIRTTVFVVPRAGKSTGRAPRTLFVVRKIFTERDAISLP